MEKIITIGEQGLFISKDIKTYVNIAKKMNVLKEKAVKRYFKEHDKGQSPDKIFDIMTDYFKQDINELIVELGTHDIYTISYDDFLDTNDGFLLFVKNTTDYYKRMGEISTNMQLKNNQELLAAAEKANANIRGLNFGIITNSIASMMIYAIQEELTINSQIRKANQEFEENKKRIELYNDLEAEGYKSLYYRGTYHENNINSIQAIYLGFCNRYIQILASNGLFDMKRFCEYDEAKSNALLNNLAIMDNKERVLVEALKKCPFNLNLYQKACDYDCFNNVLLEVLKEYDLEIDFRDFLIRNDAHRNSKYQKVLEIIAANNHTDIEDVISDMNQIQQAEKSQKREEIIRLKEQILGLKLDEFKCVEVAERAIKVDENDYIVWLLRAFAEFTRCAADRNEQQALRWIDKGLAMCDSERKDYVIDETIRYFAGLMPQFLGYAEAWDNPGIAKRLFEQTMYLIKKHPIKAFAIENVAYQWKKYENEHDNFIRKCCRLHNNGKKYSISVVEHAKVIDPNFKIPEHYGVKEQKQPTNGGGFFSKLFGI